MTIKKPRATLIQCEEALLEVYKILPAKVEAYDIGKDHVNPKIPSTSIEIIMQMALEEELAKRRGRAGIKAKYLL